MGFSVILLLQISSQVFFFVIFLTFKGVAIEVQRPPKYAQTNFRATVTMKRLKLF